jgi:hypothetical protein
VLPNRDGAQLLLVKVEGNKAPRPPGGTIDDFAILHAEEVPVFFVVDHFPGASIDYPTVTGDDVAPRAQTTAVRNAKEATARAEDGIFHQLLVPVERYAHDTASPGYSAFDRVQNWMWLDRNCRQVKENSEREMR